MSEASGERMRQTTARDSRIRTAATQRRVDALFRAMSTDYLLREQFVTDPTQVFSEYVHGARVPADKASVSNQLIYSVMASPRLVRWASAYSERNRRSFPPLNRFAADFSRAIVENGSRQVVVALLRSSMTGHDVFASDEALLQILFPGRWVGDDDPGTGGGEGTGPGTGTGGDGGTSGGTGTDPGTGGDGGTSGGTGTDPGTGGGEGTGPGTGTGTGTGTEEGTGTGTGGTEMSTGTGTGGTEQSTGTGTGGTEQSTGTGTGTGTGTEQSTGTGTGDTEQSTGTGTESDFGFLGRGYVQVTLQALAQFSTRLLRVGALDVVVGE